MPLLADTLPDPSLALQYGAAGALLFCMISGVFLLRWLMDRHDRQLKERDMVSADAVKKVTDAHEIAMKVVGTEIKGLSDQLKVGFERINTALEKRDAQQQALFDKHLDVTVKVTEGLGGMGSRLADNTREIGELKAAVREMQTHRGLDAKSTKPKS